MLRVASAMDAGRADHVLGDGRIATKLTQTPLAISVAQNKNWEIVPIWIERFALTIFAAAFFGLVILNTLHMDWIQRLGLAAGLLGFSIFLAQTLHLRTKAATNNQQQKAPA